MSDFIIVPRSIFEADKFGRETYSKREAFLDLVQMAAYDDTEVFINGYRYVKARGQVVVSKSFLAKKWGWSVDKVRRYMSYLERNGWCECLCDHQCNQPITLISITSYDSYQGGATTPTTTPATTSATTSGSTGDTQLKERNKKKKKESDVCSEAVERIYQCYPASTIRKEGNSVSLRSTADKKKIETLLRNGKTEEELTATIQRYLRDTNPIYYRMLSTFLNNIPDYSAPQLPLDPQPEKELIEYAGMMLTKEEYDAVIAAQRVIKGE